MQFPTPQLLMINSKVRDMGTVETELSLVNKTQHSDECLIELMISHLGESHGPGTTSRQTFL